VRSSAGGGAIGGAAETMPGGGGAMGGVGPSAAGGGKLGGAGAAPPADVIDMDCGSYVFSVEYVRAKR
jgi:hypothetical protein